MIREGDNCEPCLQRILERTRENKEKIDRIWMVVLVLLLSNGAENVETLTEVVGSSLFSPDSSEVVKIKE